MRKPKPLPALVLPSPQQLRTNLKGYLAAWLIVNDNNMRICSSKFTLPYFLTGISQVDTDSIYSLVKRSLTFSGYTAKLCRLEAGDGRVHQYVEVSIDNGR